ncbi:hypothetical protein O181_057176 [Austropuccinia psidii MF-1]|uniref:Uncharacterized protein n=1 Tax=Austropuccinia psidii MF-1 TaxID=1389203 RepID=A0A9Q3EEM9_9BASI|nr:hypothetical protein [Austropuccinia psidii MF-1]
MVYKDKDWEMFPKIHQGGMNSWYILTKFLKGEEIVRYANSWTPLSSKPQSKKIKSYHAQKKDSSKEEAPVASARKPPVSQPPQEGKKNKEKTGGNHIPQVTGFQKSQNMPWRMSST